MEELKDLKSVNIMMQKQHLIKTQMLVKTQQLEELDDKADKFETSSEFSERCLRHP